MTHQPLFPQARKRKRRKQSPQGEMPLLDHLKELQRRLFYATIAILVGTGFGYFWYGTNLGPVPSLGELLRGPYCALPPEVRFGSELGECRLLATGVFEMFLLRLKVGSLAGIVLSSPFWIGQIWKFITPGLKKNEKRWTLTVSLLAGLLFMVGAVLALSVLKYGLQFMLTVGQEAQVTALTGDRYFGFLLALLLAFGLSFEVPLITVLLNMAGVISYEQLKDKRRHIIVLMFALSMFITPADPFSMIALSIALTLMMEIAIQFTRINDKRRAKRNAALFGPEGLADTDATAIPSPTSLAATGPVAAGPAGYDPAPVEASTYPMPDHIPDPAPAPRSRSGARPQTTPYPGHVPPQQHAQSPNTPGMNPSDYDDVL